MFAFAEQFSGHLATLLLLSGEIVLLALLIGVWLQNRTLKKKLQIFFTGKEARDLEKILTEQLAEAKVLDEEIQELFEISNRLRTLCMKGLHKVAVQRFNPFKEVGGNQSFAVALLDGKNNGLVISSLHTREGTRVYAKPVVAGGADAFPLTDEEKLTIAEAIHGKTVPKV